MRGIGFWEIYPKTVRREARDGIKPRTADFGKAWWSRQWIGALSAFGWGSRLTRGRSYAHSGQVLDYTVDAGGVSARVQGSRPRPYKVTISLNNWNSTMWKKVMDVLAGRAEFSAHLLAGELPVEICVALANVGLSLLPGKGNDLTTECSCPDWANPCKHVAAVHYILAEALDGDPFILFALRGRDREALLQELRQRHGDVSDEPVAPVALLRPLTAAGFWTGRGDVSSLDVGFAPARVGAPVLRRLDAPGLWSTAEEMRALFGPLLAAAAEEARRVALEAGVD